MSARSSTVVFVIVVLAIYASVRLYIGYSDSVRPDRDLSADLAPSTGGSLSEPPRSTASPRSTDLAAERPSVSGVSVPRVIYNNEFEKSQITGLGLKVLDSADEIAFRADAAARTVAMRSSKGLRSPTRQEFLMLTVGLIDDADAKPAIRKQYRLSRKDGKYVFSELAGSVVADIRNANAKGILIEDFLSVRR
jgi:hypothetical protein